MLKLSTSKENDSGKDDDGNVFDRVVELVSDPVKYLKLLENYIWCCDNFLSVVVGKVPWKNKEASKKVDVLATTTDEAFCIVTLLNNEERWRDECDDKIEKSKIRKAKFTETTKTNNGRKYKGWSSQGYDVCNRVCVTIKKFRESDEGIGIMEQCLRKKQEEKSSNTEDESEGERGAKRARLVLEGTNDVPEDLLTCAV